MFEPDGELFDQALTAEIYFLNRIEKRKQTLAKLLVELTGFDPSMNQRLRDLEEWRESQRRVETNLDKIPLEHHNERAAMSVTGIQSGAFQAQLEAMRKKLSDRLTQGLTKIDGAAEAGAQKMEAAVDGIVAKVDKEIDDKLQEFAQITNGGPL